MSTHLPPPLPMQPIVTDAAGVARFRPNLIVRHILDHGGIGVGELGLLDFPVEDREQFAQLTGWSVDGFADMGGVRPDTVAAVDAALRQGTSPETERIAVLEARMARLRRFVRDLVPELFGVDSDVLDG